MTPDQLSKSGSEHGMQRALFAWANMAAKYGWKVANNPNAYTGNTNAQLDNDFTDAIPKLRWLHAIHNQGHGDAIRGAKAKAEGVTTGIWDIFLPVAANHPDGNILYAGLYIEMKVGKNTLTKEQSEFGQFANAQGYRCVVCWCWQDARDEILKYLGLR